MAPAFSKTANPRPKAQFFEPRTTTRNRRNVAHRDYANIERNEVNPSNPPRPTAVSTTPASSYTSLDATQDLEGDTIICDPANANYDSDEDMIDAPQPTFSNIVLSAEEKAEAIKKWATHKERHERKKRDKSSHVYWYMKREALPDVFYAENEGSPKCLQEYRWNCRRCLTEPNALRKKFYCLESNRRGVTTGMGKHLRTHGITADTHFARTHGYSSSPGGYTETDTWSGREKSRARLTSRQATRRWFVKTRQPFSAIEDNSFQEMFLAHGQRCAYKSRITLRNHIYDDFCVRRQSLVTELEATCTSISFTLDIWTAPNRIPIFAVIGHWLTPEFEEREEVLEFVELKGSHSGDELAKVVEKVLQELQLKPKLFAITGDNAGNNGTLCQSLFESLKRKYDDKISPIGKPQMRFHGRPSWVRCLAHIVNLICDDVLKTLKAGTAKEAKKALDSWEEEFKSNSYIMPHDGGRSAIAKVRLLNLWMLRSSAREQEWKEMPKAANRRPIYDVDTRWNSAFDMIEQFIELEAEYTTLIDLHPQVDCLRLNDDEVVALHQLAHVLRPFKTHTLQVSEKMPSLPRSLEIYWDLDDASNRWHWQVLRPRRYHSRCLQYSKSKARYLHKETRPERDDLRRTRH